MLASNPVKRNAVFDSVVAAFADRVRRRRLFRQCRQRLDALQSEAANAR